MEPSAAKGILYRAAGQRQYRESIHPVSADLAEWVQLFWSVSWDLRGQEPHVQDILPRPNVNIAIEAARADIHGIIDGRFRYVFRETGWIFGITLRPAAARAVLGRPPEDLKDRVVAVGDVLGEAGAALASGIRSRRQPSEMVGFAEDFLRSLHLEPDPHASLANQIVDQVRDDRSITRVEQIAASSGRPIRRLQRLCREHVGVGPKWIVQRYRLLEAAERLEAGQDVDLAAIALDLGYSDQAHFTSDWRRMTGHPPGRYVRSLGDGGAWPPT